LDDSYNLHFSGPITISASWSTQRQLSSPLDETPGYRARLMESLNVNLK
jgi:hypothetical protein